MIFRGLRHRIIPRLDADQGAARRIGSWCRHSGAGGRMMTRLTLILFSIISTSLMGTGIVVALTMGMDTLTPILIAAALGLVLAIPVSWLVARQIA
jgi:hypothetical protein